MYEKELRKLKSLLGPDALEILSNAGAIIAGGAITSIFTNKDVNDIDVYFPSRERLIQALTEIKGNFDSLLVVSCTDKAILMQVQLRTGPQYVQFIYDDFYLHPFQIFGAFDFTINMGAYHCTDDEFILSENFLKHNSERVLVFNEGTKYPIISLLRVQKYMERGYTIPKTEMFKIALTIARLSLCNWDELKEQLSSLYGVPVDDLFNTERAFSLSEAIHQLTNTVHDERVSQPEKNFNFAEFILKQCYAGKEKGIVYLHVEKPGKMVDRKWTVTPRLDQYQIGELVNIPYGQSVQESDYDVGDQYWVVEFDVANADFKSGRVKGEGRVVELRTKEAEIPF